MITISAAQGTLLPRISFDSTQRQHQAHMTEKKKIRILIIKHLQLHKSSTDKLVFLRRQPASVSYSGLHERSVVIHHVSDSGSERKR